MTTWFGQWRRASTGRWSRVHWFRQKDDGCAVYSVPACGIEEPEDVDKHFIPPEPILTCEKCKRLNLLTKEDR